jgi:glycosyltransferase involved in cell wall biosynthesis
MLVVQHASHHGQMSGYHRLAEYVVAQGAGRVAVHGFPRRGTWRLAQPFVRRSGLRWYGPDAFLTEIWAALTTWRGRVLHFLQGENAYRYAGALPGRRRLIATLHLPPSILGDYVVPMRHLERLAAIVFVAGNQLDLLDRLPSPPRAYVVPHGIDVEFFAPAPRPASCISCLFVGQWLRDFATLEAVVSAVQRAAPQTRFSLLLPSGAADRWRGRPGVDVLTGVDDGMLRRCYQDASLLVMPLRDCTANNAVLEAMACGLPIVVTDVGGVRDYVDERCALLTAPGDAKGMAEAVLALLGDDTRRAAMGRAARARSEVFAWPRVAERMLAIYRELV